MAVIDLYADFLGGRSQYDADSLYDLKRQVCERLNRNDINWSIYDILINDSARNSNYQFQDGDVVKVIAPNRPLPVPKPAQMDTMVDLLRQLVQGQQLTPTQISTFPSLVVKRPFLEPERKRPTFATLQEKQQFIGSYACSRCGGNLVTGKEVCAYCGCSLNWSSIN